MASGNNKLVTLDLLSYFKTKMDESIDTKFTNLIDGADETANTLKKLDDKIKEIQSLEDITNEDYLEAATLKFKANETTVNGSGKIDNSEITLSLSESEKEHLIKIDKIRDNFFEKNPLAFKVVQYSDTEDFVREFRYSHMIKSDNGEKNFYIFEEIHPMYENNNNKKMVTILKYTSSSRSYLNYLYQNLTYYEEIDSVTAQNLLNNLNTYIVYKEKAGESGVLNFIDNTIKQPYRYKNREVFITLPLNDEDESSITFSDFKQVKNEKNKKEFALTFGEYTIYFKKEASSSVLYAKLVKNDGGNVADITTDDINALFTIETE